MPLKITPRPCLSILSRVVGWAHYGHTIFCTCTEHNEKCAIEPVHRFQNGSSINGKRWLVRNDIIRRWRKADRIYSQIINDISFNPILTGGGVNLTPPLYEIRDRRRSRRAFSWLFSFKSYTSFDTKFAKIGPSVARSRDVLYSHVGTKFAQNLHFAYVCVQNIWKLLIFLKCTKTVFILSFWPFAQFLISWN